MANRIVSIAEAARLTGLPKASIRSRVERGELRAIRRAGLRRISVDELAERGLLDAGVAVDQNAGPSADLLERLESQAEEIGRLRVGLAIAQRLLHRERTRRARRG